MGGRGRLLRRCGCCLPWELSMRMLMLFFDSQRHQCSAWIRSARRRAVHDLTRCAVLLCHAMPRRATHEPTPGSIYVYVAATLINASTRRPGRKTKRYSVPSIRPAFLPSVRVDGRNWNEHENDFLSRIPLDLGSKRALAQRVWSLHAFDDVNDNV